MRSNKAIGRQGALDDGSQPDRRFQGLSPYCSRLKEREQYEDSVWQAEVKTAAGQFAPSVRPWVADSDRPPPGKAGSGPPPNSAARGNQHRV